MFEDAASDLFERTILPVQVALKNANLTLDQLESVILHGGSVRVPFVQMALEDAVGADKIAKTVNADEAAVMGIFLAYSSNVGAIFRGAQLNTQFRVKDIRLTDFSTYPINIISNATLEDSKGCFA
jgi:hypoxia up-regulated 1